MQLEKIALHVKRLVMKRMQAEEIYFRAMLCQVSFGENVRSLRARAGYTRAKDLAREMGVSPPVVSRWENDEGGLPETPTMLKLAKTLRCEIGELLAGVDADYDQLVESLRSIPVTSMASFEEDSPADPPPNEKNGSDLRLPEAQSRSATTTSEWIDTDRAQGDPHGVHVSGKIGGASAPRHQQLTDRVLLGEALLEFSKWLDDAHLIQQTLQAAADAIMGGKNGDLGTGRSGQVPRTGSGPGPQSRKGKS